MYNIKYFAKKNKAKALEAIDQTILQSEGKLVVSDLETTFVFKGNLYEEDGIYNSLGSKILSTDMYPELPNDVFSESFDLTFDDMENFKKLLPFTSSNDDQPSYKCININDVYAFAIKDGNQLMRLKHSGNLPQVGIFAEGLKKFFQVWQGHSCRIHIKSGWAKIETYKLDVYLKLFVGTLPDMYCFFPKAENFSKKVIFPKDEVFKAIKASKDAGVNIRLVAFDTAKEICYIQDLDTDFYREWRLKVISVSIVDTTIFTMLSYMDKERTPITNLFGINPIHIVSEKFWFNANRNATTYGTCCVFFQLPYNQTHNASRNLFVIPETVSVAPEPLNEVTPKAAETNSIIPVEEAATPSKISPPKEKKEKTSKKIAKKDIPEAVEV